MRLSLRLRLIILPTLVVIASIIVLGVLETRDARTRVAAESASGLQLGRLLAQGALSEITAETDPAAARVGLRMRLPKSLRHLTIDVLAPGERPAPTQARVQAPAWFTNLVAAPQTSERFPIVVAGQNAGDIVLTAAPGDEIVEVWLDWRTDMAVLAVMSAVIMAVVLLALSLALRPVSRLAEALDRLEAGDFTTRVRTSGDPQLRRLTERFNSLAASLQQVSADNQRLIERLMTVQEEERREIAAELHDEIGPSLFAIRADLGAISRWTRQPADVEVVRERLTSISSLITQLQRINSRLLERLRPVVLDQMPLAQALLSLVEGWRERHPELAWEASVDQGPEMPEGARLAIYLGAQEALTNVVRHAGAKHVSVRFERKDGRARLTVTDDGKGMAAEQVRGFGLLGMAERARAAGGKADIIGRPGGGSTVTLDVPERAL